MAGGRAGARVDRSILNDFLGQFIQSGNAATVRKPYPIERQREFVMFYPEYCLRAVIAFVTSGYRNAQCCSAVDVLVGGGKG